jgi:predicted anti-sigma-YlaC factor YlaD
MDHETVKKLLSAYLDGELKEEERRRVEAHIGECADCRKEYHEMVRLEEVMEGMKIKEPPEEAWKTYSEAVYNRIERGIGWILLSIGAMIVLFFAGYSMVRGLIQDPTIPLIVKAGILAGLGGIVILLVSVVRERLFVSKRERYKEIEK